MREAAAVLGMALILLVLWEGFESIILPRRVTRRFRLARVFYRTTWTSWSSVVRHLAPQRLGETLLSFYGPLSILLLLTVWAFGLVTGFALLHWALGSQLKVPDGAPSFFFDFYFSCTTFFTLGLGDLTPDSFASRVLTMIEGAMGLGFLALIISYLPSLNQSFARREVSISLLDARAGSPPTAAEMLIRHSHDETLETLRELLHEWERWAAELLEGHLSYPVLAYFRSQHDNQSWLGALTAVLDASALVRVALEGVCVRQAELTFAMARHALVDLSLVFRRGPMMPHQDRLPIEVLEAMTKSLSESGLKIRGVGETVSRLKELRSLYEPYVAALADYFRLAVPPWYISESSADNWQVSAWEQKSGSAKGEPSRAQGKRHF
jgi:hypothetical protein